MPEFTISYSDNASKPALWSNPKNISFEDYLELTACVFNWADSYDAKVSYSLLSQKIFYYSTSH